MTDRTYNTNARPDSSPDREDAVWLRVTKSRDKEGRIRYAVSASTSTREDIGYVVTSSPDVAERCAATMLPQCIRAADAIFADRERGR
jgi:hypothetical protein